MLVQLTKMHGIEKMLLNLRKESVMSTSFLDGGC